MHMSLGEEAIAAGVVNHLGDGDALALDHRGTAPLVARGSDLRAMLREFLGRPDGLCGGRGGHMHLFSHAHLAASSGIVGASGPLGAGLALSCAHLRPGSAAAAFFGDGAMNQGMLLESFNLAAVWKLPVIFVCKDNRWAITTRSESVTAGKVEDRVRGFGVPYRAVDGTDVEAVWDAAREAFGRARAGEGPSFILAVCGRPEGHFLGDPLVRLRKRPVREGRSYAASIVRALIPKKGARRGARILNVKEILTLVLKGGRRGLKSQWDPVAKLRRRLIKDRIALQTAESEIAHEIAGILEEVLGK
jgi:pyruvate dehydrogenase E1 component alpha subunit